MFEKFGKIRSCKTVRKELFQSYLGIKRSIKVSGYVCFENSQSAKEAKTALNASQGFSNLPKLYVDFHQSKAERNEFLKLKMINANSKAMQNKEQMPADQEQMLRNFKGFDGKEMYNSLARIFGPHMLRKFPPQTVFNYPKNFNNHMMNNAIPHTMPHPESHPQGHHFGQLKMNQMPHMQQIDPTLMGVNEKRDFFGDQLYSKCQGNPNFSQYEE